MKTKKTKIAYDAAKMKELSPATVQKSILRRAQTEKKASRRRKMVSLTLVTSIVVLVLCIGMASPRPEPAQQSAPSQSEVTVVQSIYCLWNINAQDRETVEQAVACVAAGESELCQQAVAQAIRNTCDRENISVDECIAKYQYPLFTLSVTDSVKKAVDAVVSGKDAIDADLAYCYNPKVQDGTFHESQQYVCTIGNIRFFTELA